MVSAEGRVRGGPGINDVVVERPFEAVEEEIRGFAETLLPGQQRHASRPWR